MPQGSLLSHRDCQTGDDAVSRNQSPFPNLTHEAVGGRDSQLHGAGKPLNVLDDCQPTCGEIDEFDQAENAVISTSQRRRV